MAKKTLFHPKEFLLPLELAAAAAHQFSRAHGLNRKGYEALESP